jgi:hypothetical protein
MTYSATGGGKAVVALLFVIGVGIFGGILYMWAKSATPEDRFPTRLKNSTFICREGSREAVGFFVTESGYAVASAYLFLNDTDFKSKAIVAGKNDEIEIDIIAVDPGVDVAVLEFPPGDYETVPLDKESSVLTGDQVITLQYHNVVHGEISAVNPQSKTIRFQVPLDEKVIGAPVGHQESQTVIGMINSKVFAKEGRNFREIVLPEQINNVVKEETGIDLFNL